MKVVILGYGIDILEEYWKDVEDKLIIIVGYIVKLVL